MKFKQLVKLYESKQKGPPYIQEEIMSNGTGDIRYYRDPEYKILERTEKDPYTGLTLPAIISKYKSGIVDKWWYKNNKLHQDEKDPKTGLTLPAILFGSGGKEWYINGRRHRDEKDPVTGLYLPAIEYPNGDKWWYKDGKRHRADGPSYTSNDWPDEWFINGIKLSPKEIEEQKQKIALDKQITSDENNPIGDIWSTL